MYLDDELFKKYSINTRDELEAALKFYREANEATSETLREFIDRNSNAAWISFNFEIEDRGYSCISVEDFIIDYGRLSEYLLDQYIVESYKSSYPSQSQGSTYFLTLKKKDI